MITQIIVENFQSHKRTVLDLHEGVNALIGLTGAGKSVIFKALDWVFRNRPLGDEYRSWWGGDTSVTIKLSDGHMLGRIRTKSDNYYWVDDDHEFRAFGNGGAPQAILDVLNLSDVNFQGQTDPSFLISNSSGEVAKYLNKAAHLDVIDQTLTNIAGTVRKEKEELNRATADRDLAQERLKEYSWLDQADEELIRLENVQSLITRETSNRHTLMWLIGDTEKTIREYEPLGNILSFSGKVDSLIESHKDIELHNASWEKLAFIVDQYEKTEKESERVGQVIKYEPVVSKLITQGEEIKGDREKRNKLWGLMGEVGSTQSLLDEEKTRLAASQTEFDRLMPDTCPLCGRGGSK